MMDVNGIQGFVETWRAQSKIFARHKPSRQPSPRGERVGGKMRRVIVVSLSQEITLRREDPDLPRLGSFVLQHLIGSG
jgi:hypothetical protein